MKLSKLQIKTAEQALKWVKANLKPLESRAWHCRSIERVFGRRKIGLWLRSQLLVETKTNWHFGEYSECKEYRLNLDGYQRVLALLNRTDQSITDSVVDQVTDQYKTELESGDFQYTEQSQRLHHGLQNKPKEIRTPVLVKAGYQYDYDIVCAAPTLLYQRARSTGIRTLPLIEQYIENRSVIRDHLAEQHQIPKEQIKKFITGLFQGGYISKWPHSHCYKTFGGNYNHIERMRNDPIIQGLHKEIRELWQHISKEYHTSKKLSGKEKALIYRELEQQIMNEVRKYLNKKKQQYFLIHDGFQTKTPIDQTDLEIYVRNKTRFMVKLDFEILENNNDL